MNLPAGGTDRLWRRIGGRITRELGKITRASRTMKAVLSAGGALLAGISQIPTVRDDVATWMGWTGVGLVTLAAIWILFTEEGLPAALDEARRALEHARRLEVELERKRDQYESERELLHRNLAQGTAELVLMDAQQRRLINLTNIFREGVERAVANGAAADISLQRLLDGSRRLLLGVIGCIGDERWTITIFRKNGRKLVRVANLTADSAEPATAVREWAPGFGWAGTAFLTEHEMVYPDTHLPSAIRPNVSVADRRDDDDARYRSVAAVPIRVAGMSKPWGVLVATSDQVGRYDPSEGLGGISAQAVRMLAGMAALIAAVEKSSFAHSRNAAGSLSVRP